MTSEDMAFGDIILLLHGLGQNHDDMLPLANYLHNAFPHKEILLLEGLEDDEVIGTGYQWFHPYIWNTDRYSQSFHCAIISMKNYITELLHIRQKTVEDLIIIGFSQGAIMAIQVGLEMQIKYVVSIAGILIDDKILIGIRQKSKILIVQNSDDMIVPMQAFNVLLDNLKKYDCKFELCIIQNAAHIITQEAIEATVAFLLRMENKRNDKFQS